MKITYLSKSNFLTAIFCGAFAASAVAVDPPPDGGYPNQNTAEGEDALFSLTTGENNTAVGYQALHNITDSSGNTAVGYLALANATAGPNTAVGAAALSNNTTGYNNTSVSGLGANTTGHDNTAVGWLSLPENTNGCFNTAMGVGSLGGNGSNNCAFGGDAMQLSRGASGNVAVGGAALVHGGDYNVAIGNRALYLASGSYNIAIGNDAGLNLTKDASYNIDIGNEGTEGDANTIRIGQAGNHTATFIAGIFGVTVANGVDVVIDANGQLGTLTSSARYKDEIRSMDKSSEGVLQLQPVTFRYKDEFDPEGTPQFGLVAEQVDKVAPQLVTRDAEGKPYSVRYQAVNAMLLNEFLKEHRRAEGRGAMIKMQKQRIEQLEAVVTRLQSSVEQQAAQLRKVRNRFKTARAPTQVAVSN